MGHPIVAAAARAERARPRWWVVMAVLFAISGLLDYLDLPWPFVVRVLVVVLVVGFYVFPWLVAIVRNFVAGYRGGEDPA